MLISIGTQLGLAAAIALIAGILAAIRIRRMPAVSHWPAAPESAR
jgi:hypothetical protein